MATDPPPLDDGAGPGLWKCFNDACDFSTSAYGEISDEGRAAEIADDLAEGALDPDEVDEVDPFDEGSDDE